MLLRHLFPHSFLFLQETTHTKSNQCVHRKACTSPNLPTQRCLLPPKLPFSIQREESSGPTGKFSRVFTSVFMQAFEEFLLNYATVRRIKFLKGTKRNLGAGFNSQHNDARSERKVWWKVWDTEPKHFITAAKYDIMEEANEEASINWLFFIVVKYEVERLTSQLLILQIFCLKVKLNMEIWKKSSISPLSWLLC